MTFRGGSSGAQSQTTGTNEDATAVSGAGAKSAWIRRLISPTTCGNLNEKTISHGRKIKMAETVLYDLSECCQFNTPSVGGQKQAILKVFTNHPRTWVTVDELERVSGSTRVATHINNLRDDYEIETQIKPSGRRALYRFMGSRASRRVLKPHCKTCYCRPENIGPEQLEMILEETR